MSFLDISDSWDYKYVDSFKGGINVSLPENRISDNELVSAKNVFFREGILQSDTGYTTFGILVRGIPRITFQFFKKDGTSELVLVTDSTFYSWLVNEWQYVSDGISTTTTNDEIAGQTVIEVPSTVGFTATDYIGIGLSDGTQHRTTIASISAGVSITIDDAIPVGKNTGVGAVVLKAVDLAGSLDVQISLVVLPSVDWLIFTNGIDNVKRYDGTDCIDVPNLPSAGNTQCRLVGVLENHLILAHTVEGGTRYPQRVRRSDTADPTNWTTGNAGYTDLYDSEDWLVALSYLGPYMILYRERSIVRVEYIGSVDVLFDFEYTASGEGAVSQDSVIDLGDHHIFMGNANFYEYRGGYDYSSVGDNIYDLVFSTLGDLSPSYKQRSFGFFVEELNELWFFYATSGNTIPNKLLRYNTTNKNWFTRNFSDSFVGFGLYQSTNDRTWNDLVGDWTAQNWSWDSRQLLANSPTTHLCSTDLQVYEYNYSEVTDNGVAIDYLLETKDFGHPRFKSRFDLYDLKVQGTDILFEFSKDEGVSWETLTTITSGNITRVTRNKQIVTQYLRFRLSGSNTIKIQSFAFMYIFESEI